MVPQLHTLYQLGLTERAKGLFCSRAKKKYMDFSFVDSHKNKTLQDPKLVGQAGESQKKTLTDHLLICMSRRNLPATT